MSDEECDYMSDSFVLSSGSNDVRPGLIHSRSLQRKHNIEKKKGNSDQRNKDRQKPMKIIQKENLESALQRPLDTSNRGYALLEKMGFKPGSGLGVGGVGRSEPIPIEIKTNREGLGVKAQIQEMLAEKEKKWKAAQESAPTLDDFRSRIIDEANEKQARVDLYKSQKSCYSLDFAMGIGVPMESWFWPENNSKDEKEQESDDDKEKDEDDIAGPELSVPDKLEMLTVYLRRTYHYCVWCGTTYEDEKDLRQECPGPTRNDHE